MLVYKSLILLIKLELKTYILLETYSNIMTLSKLTNLKISFLINNFWISFCLNTKNLISAYLLVNISNLFNTILTYSRYISSFPLLYFFSSKDTKNTDKDTYMMTISIRNTYNRNTYIESTYTMATQIRYANIRGAYIEDIYTRNALIRGIKLRVLVGSKVILTALRVNDWYF